MSRAATARCLAGVCAIAATALAAACSPLPGDSVDPLYLRHRNKQTTTSTASETAVAPAPATPAPPTPAQAAAGSVDTAARLWVGRYRDSRGGGEITISLRQRESIISGTWSLRTGGGGPVSGSLEGSGGRLRLTLENASARCPGKFEGWVEAKGTTLVGAYHGADCEGPVSDGMLELHAR